jgi:hypothetical protein
VSVMIRFLHSVALTTVVLSSGVLVSNSASASSITVLNPSFEFLAAGYPNFGGCGPGCTFSEGLGIPDWNTTGGETGQFQPGNPSNTFYFNFLPAGPTVAYTNGGLISQTVGATTVAGATYTLSVDVGFRNDLPDPGTVTLVLDGNSFLATGLYPGLGNWSIYTATGIATSTGGSIVIDLASNGAQGDWDNVSLSTTSTTPLPSTWTMLIAGFVGFGFFAYRGTKKNAAALSAA